MFGSGINGLIVPMPASLCRAALPDCTGLACDRDVKAILAPVEIARCRIDWASTLPLTMDGIWPEDGKPVLNTECDLLVSYGQDSEAVALSVDGHIEDIPVQAFQKIFGRNLP